MKQSFNPTQAQSSVVSSVNQPPQSISGNNVPSYPLAKGWFLEERNPQVIQSLMPLWEWLYRYYFRVETDGWHHVPSSGGMLLVGSHNGGAAAPDLFCSCMAGCAVSGQIV